MKNRSISVISGIRQPDIKDLVVRGKLPEQFRWVYFGKNYQILLNFEKTLGRSNQRISIGQQLQETALENRQNYIDYIGSIAPSDHPLLWWASSVSEKSPLISDVFLYFCYVRIFQKIISSNDDNLVFICENEVIADSLIKNCPQDMHMNRITDVKLYHRPLQTVSFTLQLLRHKSWFFSRYLGRIFLSAIARKRNRAIKKRYTSPMSTNNVVVHMWADQRSFLKKGKIENIIFPSLADQLKEKKIPFFYLVDVLPTIKYHLAINELSMGEDDFLLIEELLHPLDVGKALIFMYKSPFPTKQLPLLCGIDITGIIFDEFEKDRLRNRREESFLRFCAVQRMNTITAPSVFLYPFENQIWEKLVCAGFHKSGSKTRLTGYVHTLVRSMYTCYSLSEFEKTHTPLPDTIVVSGAAGKRTLEKSGFSKDIIIVGGALRYPDLQKRSAYSKNICNSSKKCVLIALSAGLNESIELLNKSIRSLEGMDVEILVKCHPVLPFEKITPSFGKLPENFIVADGPTDAILEKVNLVFYTETTLSVEALAQGIPIIHVKSDCRLDMNIFEDLKTIPSESDPVSIRKVCESILTGSKNTVSDEDMQFIRQLFSPIRSDFIDLCISGHV